MLNNILVRLEVMNQKASEELKRMISLMDGFHLQSSDFLEPCDLLILEIGNNQEKEFHLLHSIKASRSIREVFLIFSKIAWRFKDLEYTARPSRNQNHPLPTLPPRGGGKGWGGFFA